MTTHTTASGLSKARPKIISCESSCKDTAPHFLSLTWIKVQAQRTKASNDVLQDYLPNGGGEPKAFRWGKDEALVAAVGL